MNRVMEVDFGEAAVNSFRNLEISLKAGERELKEGTDYILQYPSVVLEDTVIEENSDIDRRCRRPWILQAEA